MKQYALLIDESEENSHLLNSFLPDTYKLVWILPRDNCLFAEQLHLDDISIVFIRMDAHKNLSLSLYNTIRSQYPACKIVWMEQNGNNALNAFEEQADAFMLLPVSREGVQNALNRLNRFHVKK